MRILSIFLLLTFPAIAQETVSFTDYISNLVMEVDIGEIYIKGNKEDQNTVIDYKTSKNSCSHEVVRKEDTVYVYNNRLKNGCLTKYNIKLPSDVEVNIQVGAGDVQVENLDAETQIFGGTANVTILDVTENISIKLGTGNLDFKANAKPSHPIDLHAEIGTGNISCSLPAESVIRKNSVKSLIGIFDISKIFKLDSVEYNFNLDAKIGVGYIFVRPTNKMQQNH